jgi:hypothetical protein
MVLENGNQISNVSEMVLGAVFEPRYRFVRLSIERRLRCREARRFFQVLVEPFAGYIVQLFFVLRKFSFLSQSANRAENAKLLRRIFMNVSNDKPQVSRH